MKLHLTTAENNYLITGYDENYIGVNNQRYQQSLIVMAQQLDTEWPVSEFAQITEVQMAELANLNPEVVLLGTGQKHQFLHPKIYQALTQKAFP